MQMTNEGFTPENAIEVFKSVLWHMLGISVDPAQAGLQVDEETAREMAQLFFAGAAVALRFSATSAEVGPAFLEAAQRYNVDVAVAKMQAGAANDEA